MSVDVAAIRADVQRDWFLCLRCAWSGHAPQEWASGVKVCPRCPYQPVRIPWNKAGHAETALALCDEVDALRAALAAKDAEIERLRAEERRLRRALSQIEDHGAGAAVRIARAVLADGEATS